jgi:hypothetical protein
MGMETDDELKELINSTTTPAELYKVLDEHRPYTSGHQIIPHGLC